MVVEHYSNGLHPSEVSAQVGISFANEMTIYMKIGIRNQAEPLILAAMEVECVAIAPNESWILTNSTRKVATADSLAGDTVHKAVGKTG